MELADGWLTKMNETWHVSACRVTLFSAMGRPEGEWEEQASGKNEQSSRHG